MRITQGYVSKSIMDFPFHEVYKLDDYNSHSKPAVFFGMYRFEDIHLASSHYDHVTVFWTGQDALSEVLYAPYRNITAHPKVYQKLIDNDYECELVKPSAFLNEAKPQRLGNKIYAYCPSTAKDYHGYKVIEELRRGGYEIIIGDGQFTQKEWRNGKADFYYKDVFVGLCLSEFAGGGGTIIEMGLRGIPVITNVFNLPHCHAWKDAQDVAEIIEQLRSGMGNINKGLANLVWGELDHEYKWLEI